MIGIRTLNDVLNGVIELFDNSTLAGNFQRAFIELTELGLRQELNAGSQPTLSDYLSLTSIKSVKFNARVDEVVTVKYTLLSELDRSGLSYTLGNNIVTKVGILNEFASTDYIYIGKLYKINRTLSTSDSLWLDNLIDVTSGSIYAAYYMEKCITIKYEIVKAVKALAFNFNNCCGCEDGKKLSDALKYIEAINVQQDCNDCEKQRKLLYRLKKLLNIC